MKTIPFSARIPEDTYKAIPADRSKNSFVVEAIQEKIERDRQHEIETSLMCLGDDPDSIEYAIDAQKRAFELGK